MELAVVRHPAGIRQFEAQLRIVLASLGDHGGRAIDAGYLGAGGGDLRRQLSGAAPDVQNPFTRPRRQQTDQIPAVLPDERMLVLIQRGIPCAHWRQHTTNRERTSRPVR